MTRKNPDPAPTDAAPIAKLRPSDMSKDLLAPNPQGKGQVGFLKDWYDTSPRGVVAKPSGRLLADYFTSLLVLSANFKFKPACETDYYLYRDAPHWTLSLIAPDEWRSAEKRRNFVGTCVLHADATWSIVPGENLETPGPVTDAVGQVFEGFVDKIRRSNTLEDDLPLFESRLPYYQRLHAAALSRSLQGSLRQGGQLNNPASHWLAELPGDVRKFLLPSSD